MPSFPQPEKWKSPALWVWPSTPLLYLSPLCSHSKWMRKEGLWIPTLLETSMPPLGAEQEMGQYLLDACKPFAKPCPMGHYINQLFPRLRKSQHCRIRLINHNQAVSHRELWALCSISFHQSLAECELLQPLSQVQSIWRKRKHGTCIQGVQSGLRQRSTGQRTGATATYDVKGLELWWGQIPALPFTCYRTVFKFLTFLLNGDNASTFFKELSGTK